MTGRPAAVLTDEGLLLPVRPPGRLLLLGLALGCLLLLVATAGLVVVAARGAWRSGFGVLVTVPGALLFGAAALALLREDRTASTGLLLTPREIRITDRDEPVVIPWEAVSLVEDSSPLADDADADDPGWLTFVLPAEPEPGLEDPLRMLSGSPYPSINARDLVAGRDLARAVCRYYRLHPDERGQLATPAALERVAELG